MVKEKTPFLPQSFTNIITLLLSIRKTWWNNFFTLVFYNLIVGFFTIVTMWYCNSLISSHLIQAEETGQVPSQFLSRLLILGEIGTLITFYPAILLCNFFALWQLETEPETNSLPSEPLKTLIKKSSSGLILLGSGWMNAIISGTNRIFLFLIFLCISGFLSGKYQSESLDISLIILNSAWLSMLLLKLSTLMVLPWLALGSKTTEIKRSKVQIKAGATWLILISWTTALSLTVLLQEYFQLDREPPVLAPHLAYQLAIQALNFYVPQPFLWFIAVVAREYAVLTPRK
jgi:hypothetical protein